MRQSKTGAPGPYFLATTALEEFWDAKQPILFLGEGCRLYRRRAYWESLEGFVMQDHWQNQKDIEDGYKKVNALYKEILPILAEDLNKIHECDHSKRYWQILIGPWLIYFLSVIYDRYLSINNALKTCPEIETVVLKKDSYVTPKDTTEFVNLSIGDAYNLQLYSQIFDSLGKKYPAKPLSFSVLPNQEKHIPKGLKLKASQFVNRILKRILLIPDHFFKKHSQIILKDSYFSRLLEFKLFLKTRGLVWPDMTDRVLLPQQLNNMETRKIILKTLNKDTGFYRILKFVIPTAIPQCYIEGFDFVASEAAGRYPARPQAILSAVGWYWDEAYKQWAAECAATGTLLLGSQHGGNYGSLHRHSVENYELSIIDRYYTWGWERPGATDCIKPFISTKLAGRRLLGADNQKKGILMIITCQSRFLIEMPFTTGYFLDYLNWQFRFIEAINSGSKKELRLRAHFADFEWDIQERFTDRFPEIGIDSWDTNFVQSLTESRLFVTGNLGTTFLEALAARKPSILFWDSEVGELRPEAKEYYDLLREVGILWNSPEKAANAINAIYDDIEGWWNEPNRQSAVAKFCERFAKTGTNPVESWANELKAYVSNT